MIYITTKSGKIYATKRFTVETTVDDNLIEFVPEFICPDNTRTWEPGSTDAITESMCNIDEVSDTCDNADPLPKNTAF